MSAVALLVGLVACGSSDGPGPAEPSEDPTAERAAPARVVSLAPAITEILLELRPDLLVGVDGASHSLPGAAELPDVGFARRLSAEGVLALAPDRVLAHEETGAAPTLEIIADAGVDVDVLTHERTVDGVVALIEEVSAVVGEDPESLISEFQGSCEPLDVAARDEPISAMFVYSRGVGTMQVSGTGTSAHAMLGLAGIDNAVTGYDGYKPLTPEAALNADPDWVVFTTRGLESSGGVDGLSQVPGLAQLDAVNAGRVASVDDFRLLAFGLGTCDGAARLRSAVRSEP